MDRQRHVHALNAGPGDLEPDVRLSRRHRHRRRHRDHRQRRAVANYDVYAYVGSDANNRSGRTRLFSYFPNDRWFRTNTSPFTGFVEGTATTEPASNTGLANYTRYRSLNTSSFELRVIRGSNNVGLHGIQIVRDRRQRAPNWVAAPTAVPAAPARCWPASIPSA